MSEKNLNQRLLIIGGILVAGAWLLFDWRNFPSTNLRAGLDIAGGFSLIFEIDDTGLEGYDNLAEDMKRLLQKRVDPKGVSNIVWRVHGRNRLEVQMPLPPARATELRERYLRLQDELFATNVQRGALEDALSKREPQRSAALTEISQRCDAPLALLEKAAAAHDAYAAALEAARAVRPAGAGEDSEAPTSAPVDPQIAVRRALEEREDAIDAVLATNVDPRRFRDMLEMDERSPIRAAALGGTPQHPEGLIDHHPKLREKIEAVVAAHAEWRKARGFLDGPSELRQLLRGSGVLEWRILVEPSLENPTQYDRYREQLAKHGPRRQRDDREQWFKVDNPVAFFNLKSPAELARFDPRALHRMVADKHNEEWYVLAHLGPDYEMTGGLERKWQLKGAGVTRDERGRPSVAFTFDARGGDLFRNLTRKNIDKELGIFLDGVCFSAARIQTEIGTHGRITGDFSREQVQYLVNTMQAGALPARLKDTPLSERTIGSSLGEENLRKALQSGWIGAAVVALLMGGYYLKCGMIANIAVAMNVFLTLAVMAMLGARITLDGIAGLILSLGMAVDANVLIHERMREEQERGAPLRAVIKSGYDKAFRAILDGHVTTLLTSVIIYYVGSEEIRGFGLMLGWGIVLSLFTSVFVTRTLLVLLAKWGWVRRIEMFKLISVPRIDWYAKRRVFLPLSLVITLAGLAVMGMRSPKDYLDVEFLGGTTATLELKQANLTFADISERIKQVGLRIAEAGRRLDGADVRPSPSDPLHLQVRLPEVDATLAAALVAEPLEDANLIVRGGVSASPGGDAVDVHVRDGVSADQLRAFLQGQAREAAQAGAAIGDAIISAVLEAGAADARGRLWEITSTSTNRALVQHAIVAALGDNLRVQQRLSYTLVGEGPEHLPFAITDRKLETILPAGVAPAGVSIDVTDYLNGAAIVFDRLEPPQPLDALRARLRNIRLQPGHQDLPWRSVDVFGLRSAGEGGSPLYSAVAVAVVDPSYSPTDDPALWLDDFARKEQLLARTAFETEQALQKVSQFKPQIAAQSQARAVVAIAFSWAMIIGYLWLRFGSVMYGVGGVVGMVHTVLLALSFVGFAGLIGGAGTILGEYLLIDNFKINMTVIAALLTLIGYAINDTIVTFDRIREIRGRLGIVTPQTINRAVNECMSRTLLTGTTVLAVLLVMYIFGGPTLRGFNFCMFIGVVAGTYSSIAIASPLLLLGARERAAAPRGMPATA